MKSKKNNQVIFILGMHRSGTSAMAGALSLLGMGFDPNLVEAVPNDNPNGYWEPVDVVKINNDIFTALNMHYMDFSSFPIGWMNHDEMNLIRHRISDWFTKSLLNESLIVVKDPRLCRTLPIWVEVLEQQQGKAKYIHVFRHPMDVVSSLRARDDTFSIIEGLLAWLSHVLDSFVFSPPGNSVIVSYGALMDNPLLTLGVVADNLNLEWPKDPKTMAVSLREFLKPSLAHHHFKGKIQYSFLNRQVKLVFNYLHNYDLKSPNKEFLSRLYKYQAQFQESRYLFEDIHKINSSKLKAEKTNAAEQVGYRDSLVTALKGQLKAEKTNAAEQVGYRDSLVTALKGQLKAKNKLLGSRKDLLKLFFRPLKQGEL